MAGAGRRDHSWSGRSRGSGLGTAPSSRCRTVEDPRLEIDRDVRRSPGNPSSEKDLRAAIDPDAERLRPIVTRRVRHPGAPSSDPIDL